MSYAKLEPWIKAMESEPYLSIGESTEGDSWYTWGVQCQANFLSLNTKQRETTSQDLGESKKDEQRMITGNQYTAIRGDNRIYGT